MYVILYVSVLFRAQSTIKQPTKKSRKDLGEGVATAATDARPPTDVATAAATAAGSKLSPALEFCKEILKELFGKRHAVSQSPCLIYWSGLSECVDSYST